MSAAVTAVTYYGAEETTVMGQNGKMFGWYPIGIINCFVAVFNYHAFCLIHQSNLDILWLPAYLCSLSMLFLFCYLNDQLQYGVYHLTIFTELLKSPVFWLSCLIGTATFTAPYYAFIKYKQFFWGDPITSHAYTKRSGAIKPLI